MSTASDSRTRGLALPRSRVALDARLARIRALTPVLLVATALSLWIAALWLAGGVRLDEIARYVPYELGFVFLPGWLVYRALVVSPGGRLREIVFGWSLGYLLEVVGLLVTAAAGLRAAFYVYPLLVGIPAALVARRRALAAKEAPRVRSAPPLGPVWVGALLCILLLLYAGAVGFTQTPLPRDTASVTYQEDTVFTISLAAEALHHWPLTMPSVAGEPLRYHAFAFMHMAAISQVTGIDLSVVVMRLYEIPLLLLFALQLILAGRRIGRSWSAGLAALFVVMFLGELDASTATGVGRFLFRDLFFYWLLASHTFLLGLVFFLPAVLILCDLLGDGAASRRSRRAAWVLFAAFLLGCVGSKSYSLAVVGGALVLFLLWRFLADREVHRPAMFALGVSAAVYVAANLLVFGWNAAGAVIRPFRNLESMKGVQDLDEYFGYVWGTPSVPPGLGVAFGVFGLLGVPILGIALLLKHERRALSQAEMLCLCLFVAVLPTLFISSQPGFGQMFLVFFGVVPGTILAAGGYVLWFQHARPSLRSAVLVLAAVATAVVALDLLLEASPRVGLQITLFVVAVAAVLGGATRLFSRRLVLPVSLFVGILGLLLVATPLVRLLSSSSDESRFPIGTAAAVTALVLGIAGLAAGTLYAIRGRSSRGVFAGAAVMGVLLLAALNTPLDWFPHLVGRWTDGKPAYNQELSGLTAGLYEGLTWIRENTGTDDVLVVNNYSLQPDERDSKYFYYSAFAERRVVLESWDYTEQTAATGRFSLPAEQTPFPRRLALSSAVFRDGNERAARVLARDHGARYFVADKLHGPATPSFTRLFPAVFSNEDVDVYDVGRPGQWLCSAQQEAGIAALFGHRRTPAAAERLRSSAERVGFTGLDIQRRGCFDYAVVLADLVDLAQAHEFRRQAATVDFHVTLECRTHAATGGLSAVFGHRRTKAAAEQLAGQAASFGFSGLVVQQDACGDWEVDLPGLETAAQRSEFRRQAESVGLAIRFEPG